MNELDLLFDLHRGNPRQGPGSRAATLRAIALARLDRGRRLQIADLGCGTGAAARVLAEALDAQVTAVDFGQPFLDELEKLAAESGLADRIETLNASIDDLPFDDGRFDVVWSEGAIYNIGFEKGVADWWPHLKPGGLLVASEITWLTNARPGELQHHWDEEYPGIDVASARIRILEKHGYSPAGYFVLPERCWLDEYYRPLQARFDDFLERHCNRADARAIVAAEQREIELYEKYKACVGYGMYIARKPLHRDPLSC